MKKKHLSDLDKARSHFVKAATEWIIGAGFAIKGIKNLLRDSEGRELISNAAGSSIKKGLGLMMTLSDILKEKEEKKPSRSKSSGKKSRKIKIE